MRNYWNLSLLLSVVIHAGFFLGLFSFLNKDGKFLKETENNKELEIISENQVGLIREPRDNFYGGKPSSLSPPYVDKFLDKLMAENEKEVSLKKNHTLEKNIKEVSLCDTPLNIFTDVALDKDLIKIPAYMEYYHSLRENIKVNTYKYYRTPDRGKVFLKFWILNSGYLEKIEIMDESVNSVVLREIALKSVREAAPFSHFTGELADFDRLEFKIYIDFQK